MRVTRLQIAPVKGTRLHDMESVELDESGVAENRRFYFIDAHGLMFNGKKDGRLVQIRAEYDIDRERLVLRFPDGQAVGGRWEPADAVTTSFYGRPVAGHIVEGEWATAVSEFIGQPVRLVAADRLSDAVDVHPVTIVSSASIARLHANAPMADFLEQRFRMLVELDGADAHEEDTWCGRHVRIGAALVSVFGPVPRCVVVSQNPDDGFSDFSALKTILAYRGALSEDLSTPTDHLPDGGKIVFGVYGGVVEPGRIALGDSVDVLSEKPLPVR